MFRFVIEDARKFKHAIDAIVNLIDEGTMEMDAEGITLKAMDPSQISMVCFSMPKSAFVEYEVANPERVGLNFENLSKILARARSDEKLEIYREENKVMVKFSSGKKRRAFKLPVLEMPASISREPKVEPDVVIKMLGANFKNQLKDAALVSTHVSLNATEDGFKIDVKGDSTDLVSEQEKDSEEIIEMTVKAESKATFPLQYLDDITKACPDASPLALNLKTNAPVKVEYDVEGAKLVYYLAPRIESD
ncbi:proliferating cell nuclear antigen (pcna) [Candidatus Micrarchaeota archaeon CG10_big_fil_rev_8_21_14_0_10_45_29]|nr:MAG: proliferating cell nuclear antigen (pcna) [Candidatus Micrarchaeota archaeon CG10_big_fil_rev_8_21_14_0_10_45_29]